MKKEEQGTFDFICEKCAKTIEVNEEQRELMKQNKRSIVRPLVEQLVERRKELGMTQEVLNHNIGLPDRYLSKWEVSLKEPKLWNFLCWVEALDCHIVISPNKHN